MTVVDPLLRELPPLESFSATDEVKHLTEQKNPPRCRAGNRVEAGAA